MPEPTAIPPRVLWTDGYRPFFLLFPTWGAASLVLWIASWQGDSFLGVADHAVTMIWGVLGSAVIGFLLTAYPRQNAAPSPTPRLIAALLAGQILVQAALGLDWADLVSPLVPTVIGGALWVGVLAWALHIAIPSLRRSWEPTTAAVPLALTAALAGWLVARLGAEARLGFDLGIHGFLVLLSMSLLDRLLPFFSSRVVPGWDGRRAPGFVPLLALALGARVAFASTPMLPDIAVTAVLLRQWIGWRPHQGVRVPMVAVLHLAILWVVAGYLAEAAGAPRSIAVHFWMVGGLTTLLLGFSARVVLGHAGRPLRADGWLIGVLGLAQLAAVLRAVVPILHPAALAWAIPVSGLVLAGAFLVWLVRLGPLVFRR